MKGVILDAASLGEGDLPLDPITELLDTWDVYETTTASQLPERIKHANILLTNKVPLSEDAIASATNLELISVLATGTDNIDIDSANTHNVTVSNAVAYATPSVMQHTIGLMLALSTRLIDYVGDVKAGRWQNSPAFCLLHYPITELSGKKLGIVGYGELGQHVARLAEAFGMSIKVSQRIGEEDNTANRVPFEELASTVDYLSLHCPLTPRTRHMIDQDTLGKMKPSAFLINTARGGLVDSNALISALEQNVISGAAIDVLDTEPPGDTEPLVAADLDNLIVTPHNAWGSMESRERLIMQTRENILAWLEGKPIRVVNH